MGSNKNEKRKPKSAVYRSFWASVVYFHLRLISTKSHKGEMTRNRVGGNTPRGFESHLLRQNNSHPFGWLLFFCSEGGIRKAALRNMPVACFNRRGFSAEKESHRPDLSARSIRRDGRIGAECMRCLPSHLRKKNKKILPADGISRRAAVFHAAKSRRKSAGKCRFSPVLIIIFSV